MQSVTFNWAEPLVKNMANGRALSQLTLEANVFVCYIIDSTWTFHNQLYW